jgi:hypothetical protein
MTPEPAPPLPAGQVTIADLYRELGGLRRDMAAELGGLRQDLAAAATHLAVADATGQQAADRLNDHEVRLRLAEQLSAKLLGMAAATGAGSGFLTWLVSAIVHHH